MSLQDKLKRARENLNISIDAAEEIQEEELKDNVPGFEDDLELIQNQPDAIIESVLDENPESAQDVIQLYQLVQDFEYIRETLRENAQNGRRVLRSVAQDILDTEDDKKQSMIMSFQELNKAIQENIKLYISTYKTITETLKNIQHIHKTAGIEDNKKKDDVTYNTITTSELISRIRGS